MTGKGEYLKEKIQKRAKKHQFQNTFEEDKQKKSISEKLISKYVATNRRIENTWKNTRKIDPTMC